METVTSRRRSPLTQRLPVALVASLATTASLAILGVGCGGGASGPRPEATLAREVAQQEDFRAIRDAWEARTSNRNKIEQFIARYPNQPLTRLARVYLAFALMEEKNYLRANAELSQLEKDLPPGSTRDLYSVAKARAYRHQEAYDLALQNLRPLVGKVVDLADREIFLEELALSATKARLDYEAIAYMDAWLRGVGENDKESVRARVKEVIAGLPPEVVEATYRSIRSRGAASGYGVEVQRILAARLGEIAVQKRDAALARWLLDESVVIGYAGGDNASDLGELATSQRGLKSIRGRTVGLLLPTRSSELRDDAAEVMLGVSWALGLPRRDPTKNEGIRLVTRDDGRGATGVAGALEELVGEGASVVIAGLDPTSSDEAVKWGEANGLNVIALFPPSKEVPVKSSAYVLGASRVLQLEALANALADRGVQKAAFVSSANDRRRPVDTQAVESGGRVSLLPAVGCKLQADIASGPRFPVDEWLKEGAHGWIVSGPTQCARDVLRDVSLEDASKVRFTKSDHVLALTLEAGVPAEPRGSRVHVISVQTGVVPVFAARAEDAPDEEIRAFMEEFGSRPSFWAALGRDAGKLSKLALVGLPLDSVTDDAQVKARRAVVDRALGNAQMHFWTTEANGFAGKRAMARTLNVVDWPLSLEKPKAK